MIVVSNTTPLSSLASIERLDILTALFGVVSISEAVRAELSAGGFALDPHRFPVQPLIVSDYARLLRRELDEGETQTIALAKTLGADLALIDERLAYTIAKAEGVNVAGTLTVLLSAKKRGVIPAVKPLLNEIIEQGQWYSRRLYDHFLSSIGERP